ncbi:MAG: putative rrp44-like exonuclease [Hyperionvirus sp.]|uniref:Putative rrp44-like exonuclease n=1 Tax=Hyperionvirus sp. TaxID=2487770 RepID=A0A3G5A8W5_9VIRU|nr:MAG: putative rrp44-like exonuclease [Hyperionvirus sp.]
MAMSVKRNFICGVLHLSSKLVYELDGKIMKPFRGFEKSSGECIVGTKRGYSARDLYCVITLGGMRGDLRVGTVEKYIGEVGDENAEREYLRLVCVMTWSGKDRLFVNYYGDLYFEGRRELDEEIYSIDPSGCVDIDDAIHVRAVGDGFNVGVHIADVSCYIAAGSALDRELSYRAESVYLKYCQVNMIPSKLMAHYSLTAGGIRKCVYSVVMKLDKDCKLVDVQFVRNTIIVKKNLSYEEANERVTGELSLMYNVGKRLYISLGLGGEYDVHTMVEAYMVLANSLVAERICRANSENALLRRQGGSRKEEYKVLGDSDDKNCLVKRANVLLMNKAEYIIGVGSEGSAKHVGLKCDLYTHFTSPIRRYADIIVHRMLTDPNYTTDSKTIDHINIIHSKYHKCERLSDQLEKIFNIQKHYGEEAFEVDGNVIDIMYEDKAAVKIYIELLDLTIESQIFSKKLAHLVKCSFDSDTLIITGMKNKITLSMFQKVRVKIAITRYSRQKIIAQILTPDVLNLFDPKDIAENFDSD